MLVDQATNESDQLFSSFGFGKKRLASVFPNLSSQGVEQEKTSVINGRVLTALNGNFIMGTKDDDFLFDQKLTKNSNLLSPTGNLCGCIAATQGRCIPGGAAAPLAVLRSRWSLDLRERLTLVFYFQLVSSVGFGA